MEVVGLSLAVLGGAELCLKYGRIMIDKYTVYCEAEKSLGDVILRLQLQWSTIECQLEQLNSKGDSMTEELQSRFSALFQHLRGLLHKATMLVDSAVGEKQSESTRIILDKVLRKKGKIHKFRLAHSLQRPMEKLLEDLERWQSRIQPAWFLLALIPNSLVDQQLTTERRPSTSEFSKLHDLSDAINRRTSARTHGTILPPDSIVSRPKNEDRPILYCPAKIMQESGTDDLVLVESFYPLQNLDLDVMTKHVNDFACRLSAVDPKIFGIPTCHGIIEVYHPSSKRIKHFQIVFSIPGHLQVCTPHTLRELLIDAPSYPLEERFRLATQLARSVVFVHATKFVHKNIRPETILVFQSETENTEAKIGKPFLMGFDNFRPADGKTFRVGDLDWKKNLYRHPTRQGIHLEQAYTMQHDIYSLGVCLLEIGLWDSFMLPDPDKMGDDYDNFKLSPNLKISQYLRETGRKRKAQKIKGELLNMAKNQLPSKTGSRYAGIVVLCMSCLDDEDNNFGQMRDLLDENGILVGVKYIEKVSRQASTMNTLWLRF
ncbi:hypothetical protein EDC01DRAFT_625227 [Geopyxis carbonaria]|nr:hypothetical protein EDC01DRAFT_625227 [Geopyxis carbonaria]